MLDPLSQLAVRHGSDMYGWHDYSPHYHRMFEKRRLEPVRVLVLGIGGGADPRRGGETLATWRDYFPNGRIVGVERYVKRLDLGRRVRCLRASPWDDEDAERIAEAGPFDIVIDRNRLGNGQAIDAHHLIWPTLPPGAIYVIEAIRTAFRPRRGGSLAGATPNILPHFLDIATRRPVGVAAVARLHNMIVIHKTGRERGLAHSTAAGLVTGPAPMLVARTRPLPARLAGLPIVDRCDSRPTGFVYRADQVDLDRAMGELGPSGMLLLIGAPSDALAARLKRLWSDIDHKEKRAIFPAADFDPLATKVVGMERWREGVVLVKGSYDYPSIWDFDPDHPRVSRAFGRMSALLLMTEEESGLVAFADMQAKLFGHEAALPWLKRLMKLGATSKGYFELACAVAMARSKPTLAAELYTAAQARHPDHLPFLAGYVTTQLAQGNIDAARDRVTAALDRSPDPEPAMHLLLARIAEAAGRPQERVGHAQAAHDLLPGRSRRAQAATLELGLALADSGRTAEAEPLLEDVATFARARRALEAIRARPA